MVTFASDGTSEKGFAAEWRGLNILTVEGDLIDHGEIFDEDDLEAALARFDELTRPTPRLENAASRMDERLWKSFAARDWVAMAAMMTDDFESNDHRRVVNSGVLRGPAAHVTNMKTIVEVGVERMTSAVIATRGERTRPDACPVRHPRCAT